MGVGSTEVFKSGSIIRSGITSLFSAQGLSCGSSNAQSSTFIATGYRKALAYLTVSDTGSTAVGNTVQFVPQFSESSAGTNWFDYREGVWASMVFSAVQLQTSTFRRAHTLPLDGRRLRFSAERNTTVDAINFTVSVSLEAQD